MNCQHTDTVPVEAVPPTGTVETVAHLCVTCNQQFPVNWGCPDCDWKQVELPRRLCDPAPTFTRACTRPCTTHQEARP